jgi:FKBP-type peptidyl-prolyl cis-trans isomerase
MIRIAFLAAACLAAAVAQAQVYKCVDSSGKVVYSQNPCPPSMKSESMSRGGPSATAPSAADAAADKASKSGPKTAAEQEQAFRKRQQDQAKASKEADLKNAQDQAKAANCNNAKQRLTQFEIGGRIAKIDEKGERYFLEDTQIESEKNRARADISQYCN